MKFIETTEEKYNYALGVLPPKMFDGSDFLVGEVVTHSTCSVTGRYGQPFFAAYIHRHPLWLVSDKALTREEFEKLKQMHDRMPKGTRIMTESLVSLRLKKVEVAHGLTTGRFFGHAVPCPDGGVIGDDGFLSVEVQWPQGIRVPSSAGMTKEGETWRIGCPVSAAYPELRERRITELYSTEDVLISRLKEIQESGDVVASHQGWEFWAQTDQLRFVNAFRMSNGDHIRLVSPPRSKAGHSDLLSKTKEIEVP